MQSIKIKIKKILLMASATCVVGLQAGCAGTKILKHPQSLEITQPLSPAADPRMAASLDWVIVRDGPGTWAKNADWDEYLVSVVNQTDAEIRITGVTVVDSLGTLLTSLSQRKGLLKESKQTIVRYKGSNLKVKAGMGAGKLIVRGAAIGGVGAAVLGSVGSAAIIAGPGVPVVAAGVAVVVVAPVIIVAGVVRHANNSKVAREIESRHTELPATVMPGDKSSLNLFFPLAPSPKRLEITYDWEGGTETLIIDTSKALNGLHLVKRK